MGVKPRQPILYGEPQRKALLWEWESGGVNRKGCKEKGIPVKWHMGPKIFMGCVCVGRTGWKAYSCKNCGG